MEKKNTLNYSVQDLKSARPIIAKMLADKKSIRIIFTYLRKSVGFSGIGDYPLLWFICSVAKENGHKPTARQISIILNQTGEFKNARENNQFIKQICD